MNGPGHTAGRRVCAWRGCVGAITGVKERRRRPGGGWCLPSFPGLESQRVPYPWMCASPEECRLAEALYLLQIQSRHHHKTAPLSAHTTRTYTHTCLPPLLCIKQMYLTMVICIYVFIHDINLKSPTCYTRKGTRIGQPHMYCGSTPCTPREHKFRLISLGRVTRWIQE